MLMAFAGTAHADIRIDPEDRPRPPPAEPAPPIVEVPPESKGCAAKSDMAPEWVFGLAAIGFGAYFLRKRPRTA